jgi:hypothetical protein
MCIPPEDGARSSNRWATSKFSVGTINKLTLCDGYIKLKRMVSFRLKTVY